LLEGESTSWLERRILVTVKTYPTPSQKDVETSCTAGITDDGSFIRLYPVPFRLLEENKKFKRYSWIRVPVRKARSDSRPESHTPDYEALVVEGEVDTKRNWAERKRLILPLLAPSMEDLRDRCARDRTSLGIIKPREITGFSWKDTEPPDWTPSQLARLQQMKLGQRELVQLEKIPKEFRYTFVCDDITCTGHDMQVFDWEIAQAYRSWRRRYPDPTEFERAFMTRFRDQMIGELDTHFFVGTMSNHPTTWTIIGLFYPKKHQ